MSASRPLAKPGHPLLMPKEDTAKRRRYARVIFRSALFVIAWLHVDHSPQPVHGQAVARIGIERVLTLRDPDGTAGLTSWSAVQATIDQRGRVLIPNGHTSSQIAVYDRQGRLVQMIGRAGDGPGEFRSIHGIEVDDVGRLHVFDMGTGRHTVMSAEFQVLRTRIIGMPLNPTGVARFAGDTLVVNWDTRVRDMVGTPLHVLDHSGQRVRSIGDQSTVRPDQHAITQIRHVKHSSERQFWAAQPNEYLLQLWDLSGTKHREIRRNVSWFEPWFQPIRAAPDVPPRPTLTAIQPLSGDRILVLIHVPGRNWQKALRPSSSGFGGYVPDPQHEYWDSVVELLDTRSGDVIASARFDQLLMTFADASHVVGYREDEAGEPVVELWRLRLPANHH